MRKDDKTKLIYIIPFADHARSSNNGLYGRTQTKIELYMYVVKGTQIY